MDASVEERFTMAKTVVPWVMARVGEGLLAIESSWVREMLVLPPTTGVPLSVGSVRGVFTLRNEVVPVVDLRRLLGMSSAAEENQALLDLFAQRAGDHRRWVAELETSVREARPFKLTLDPHGCAFGKWYDTYKAPNVVLESHLKRFGAPHQAIHGLGAEVAELVRQGSSDKALQLIDGGRETILATLMQLFDETPRVLAETNREMVLVLQGARRRLGVTADAVESVEPIRPESLAAIQGLGSATSTGLVSRTARTAKGDRLVLVMEVDRLLAQFSKVSREVEREAA
jgi:chemotaxis signal transduction protein